VSLDRDDHVWERHDDHPGERREGGREELEDESTTPARRD
jgi:hypothetical protein